MIDFKSGTRWKMKLKHEDNIITIRFNVDFVISALRQGFEMLENN